MERVEKRPIWENIEFVDSIKHKLGTTLVGGVGDYKKNADWQKR